MKRSSAFVNVVSSKKISTDTMANNQTGTDLQTVSRTANNFGEGSSRTYHSSNNDNKHDNKDNPGQNRFNFFGKSITEKTYFFTGSVERVIKWHRVFKQPCYFEVIASVVSVQEGSINLQKIILLKDRKGPILQVLHYVNHVISLEAFNVGQMLRCVGYMSGPNILTAISIRLATPEEVTTLRRYCYIGDFSISGLIKSENNN